jgi:hypothetical protein
VLGLGFIQDLPPFDVSVAGCLGYDVLAITATC